MKLLQAALVAIAAGLVATSCSETSTTPDADDHSLISTVVLDIVPTGGEDTLYVRWRDLDGPGGTLPLIDTVELAVDVEYSISVRLFNDLESLTPLIDADKEHHQFLWDVDGLSFEFGTSDWDSAPKLYARRVTIKVLDAGTGTLRLQLFHYDQAEDKVSGQPGNESDIDITFPLVVKD